MHSAADLQNNVNCVPWCRKIPKTNNYKQLRNSKIQTREQPKDSWIRNLYWSNNPLSTKSVSCPRCQMLGMLNLIALFQLCKTEKSLSKGMFSFILKYERKYFKYCWSFSYIYPKSSIPHSISRNNRLISI